MSPRTHTRRLRRLEGGGVHHRCLRSAHAAGGTMFTKENELHNPSGSSPRWHQVKRGWGGGWGRHQNRLFVAQPPFPITLARPLREGVSRAMPSGVREDTGAVAVVGSGSLSSGGGGGGGAKAEGVDARSQVKLPPSRRGCNHGQWSAWIRWQERDDH